ncbi:MAG: DUF418 domain-containing protein [Alphaproteobacteria bacterium]|nr:DUF418 domain-containing protein [Alphaproteobacteria bacterium]
MQPAPDSGRLTGLDFARFLAFSGMVFVNFHVVMGAATGTGPIAWFLGFLEGKAAATFVVLAGVGLGLAARRTGWGALSATTMKRAVFLMAAGLLNSLIFPADILHYYAIFFVVGVLMVPLSSGLLWLVVILLPMVFVVMVGVMDYERGWNWETLEYAGFWTAEGFVRNLLFNGWHPVVPWLGFFVLGMVLARLDLNRFSTQMRLAFGGALALSAAYALSFLAAGLDPELSELAGLSPIPPLPLYMLAGSGTAALVIGVCLSVFSSVQIATAGMWGPFLRAGRQALTLYLVHILVGMGILEAMGLLSGQSIETSFYAALAFVAASVLYAWIWGLWARRGPAEWLMRKVAG